MKINILFFKFLVILTPLLYFFKEAYSIPFLNNIKDLIIIFLGLLTIMINLKNNLFNKYFIRLVRIYVLIFLVSLINFEDTFFYLVSLRELIVYPIFYMSIGQYFKDKLDFNKYIYYGAIFSVFLMYFFLILFPDLSFGLTFRFKGFFDREHLPAIFSSIAIIYSLYYQKNNILKIIVIVASLILIALTGTRSVLLALILVYVIFVIKLNVKNLISIYLLGIVGYLVMQFFFTRDILYNLEDRESQYDLAEQSIAENFFVGIGIDKYGVLGDRVKEYSYNGYSTVTMDSSFIKYAVNIGIPLTITYLIYLLYLIYIRKSSVREKEIMVKRVLLLTFLMGTVTGKFGAYPLNMLFFMNIVCPNLNLNSDLRK